MPADLEASEEGGFTSQAGAACGAQALVNCVHFLLPCSGRGICFPVIKSCVFGSEVKSVHQDDGSLPPRAEPTESSTARQVFKLLFCAAGLQVGVLCMFGCPILEEGSGQWVRDCQFLQNQGCNAVLDQGWVGGWDSPPLRAVEVHLAFVIWVGACLITVL